MTNTQILRRITDYFRLYVFSSDRSLSEITFIPIDRVSKYCSKSISWHTYRYTYIQIIYTHRKLGYNYEWRVSKHYGIGTRYNIKCLSYVASIVLFSFGTIEINTINFSFYFDFYSPWPTSILVVYTMTFYHLHKIWLLSVLSHALKCKCDQFYTTLVYFTIVRK